MLGGDICPTIFPTKEGEKRRLFTDKRWNMWIAYALKLCIITCMRSSHTSHTIVLYDGYIPKANRSHKNITLEDLQCMSCFRSLMKNEWYSSSSSFQLHLHHVASKRMFCDNDSPAENLKDQLEWKREIKLLDFIL